MYKEVTQLVDKTQILWNNQEINIDIYKGFLNSAKQMMES